MQLRTTPRDYQIECVEEIEDFNGRALVAMDMGLGKAQPLDSRVLTPLGWVCMGNVAVGDQVIGADGAPTRITGIFPQGMQEVYKVSFHDGSSCECSNDHLWAVSSPSQEHQGRPPRVLTTRQIRASIHDAAGNCQHYIPMVQPVRFAASPVPLDPYLLGYLLANGCLSTGSPSVSIADREAAAWIRAVLPAGVALKKGTGGMDYKITLQGKHKSGHDPLTMMLRDRGLMDRMAHEKSIPARYLYNSLEVRIELFQGLMDGAGSVHNNDLRYCSTSRKLIHQVRQLIQSFGGTATICSKHHREVYELRMILPPGIAPFCLARKMNRHKHRTSYRGPCRGLLSATRAITKVEYIGRKTCQCIRVANEDHLYVTDDYIVTHNTVTALLYLHRHPEITTTVVVCPASAKWVWEHECRKHLGMRAEILEGTRPDTSGLKTRSRIWVVNYSILYAWLDFLKSLKPQLVICDEAHATQQPNSRQTLCVRALAEEASHLLALTGTPVLSRAIELWPILSMLQPRRWGNYFSFGHTYGAPQRTRNGRWIFRGTSNADKLHRKLQRSCLVRRRKLDVLKDLPPKQRTIVPLPLSDRKEYDHAIRDFLGWLRQQSPIKANRASRAEKIVKVGYIVRLIGQQKVPAVIDWINDFLATGDKLLLYAVHKKVISALEDKYKRLCVKVDGSVVGRNRKKAFDQFNKVGRTRLCLGNIKAAGTAWSCTATSSVALAELPWTPGDLLQAEDRVYGVERGVAGRHAQSYVLVAHNTWEEKLCSMLQNKSEDIANVLDGGVTDNGLDLRDLLLQELEKEARR